MGPQWFRIGDAYFLWPGVNAAAGDLLAFFVNPSTPLRDRHRIEPALLVATPPEHTAATCGTDPTEQLSHNVGAKFVGTRATVPRLYLAADSAVANQIINSAALADYVRNYLDIPSVHLSVTRRLVASQQQALQLTFRIDSTDRTLGMSELDYESHAKDGAVWCKDLFCYPMRSAKALHLAFGKAHLKIELQLVVDVASARVIRASVRGRQDDLFDYNIWRHEDFIAAQAGLRDDDPGGVFFNTVELDDVLPAFEYEFRRD